MNTTNFKLKKAIYHCTAHPLLGKYVQWMDIDFALRISNPNFSQTTDLGHWGAGAQNPQVSLDLLLKDILQNGMRDPFIVAIGFNSCSIRLETGNQRIRVFKQLGLKRIPVVGFLGHSQIVFTGNGVHEGLKVLLKNPNPSELLGPYTERKFCKISEEVFHPEMSLLD